MAKYRYNGIELPALPEYDTATYPISVITEYEKYDGTKYYILMVSNTITRDSDVIQLSEGLLWRCRGNDFLSWEVYTPLIPDTAFNLYEKTTNILWANITLLKSDGSVWIEASEPTLPLSWQSKTPYRRINGQWVKQDTYKRVNGEWVKQDEFRRET